MGNLFNQWQQDFEKKHSEILDSQQKLERSLNARMDQVESLTRSNDGGQSEIITELIDKARSTLALSHSKKVSAQRLLRTAKTPRKKSLLKS